MPLFKITTKRLFSNPLFKTWSIKSILEFWSFWILERYYGVCTRYYVIYPADPGVAPHYQLGASEGKINFSRYFNRGNWIQVNGHTDVVEIKTQEQQKQNKPKNSERSRENYSKKSLWEFRRLEKGIAHFNLESWLWRCQKKLEAGPNCRSDSIKTSNTTERIMCPLSCFCLLLVTSV